MAHRIASPQLHTFAADPGADFLAYRDSTYNIGRWAAGAAVGKISFEGIPDYKAPAGASERARKDFSNATGLTYIKPRHCFDAWQEARRELADFLEEEHRLELRGYTDLALQDGLKGWAAHGMTRLATGVKALHTMHQYAAEMFRACSTDFGQFSETEAQQAAYDLALVERFKSMTPIDRTTWAALLRRPDSGEIDKRTLAALHRVPRVLHSISEEDMGLMLSKYFSEEWPKTHEAMGVLHGCIAAAHDAIRTTVNIMANRSGLGREVADVTMKDAAQWLQLDMSSQLGNGPGVGNTNAAQ